MIRLVSLSVLGWSAYYVLNTPTIAAILPLFQGVVKVSPTHRCRQTLVGLFLLGPAASSRVCGS